MNPLRPLVATLLVLFLGLTGCPEPRVGEEPDAGFVPVGGGGGGGGGGVGGGGGGDNDAGVSSDGGTTDGGALTDGGTTDGGFSSDGGSSDGGVKTDGGVTDGGFGFDGGTSDGGVKTDGGTTDGGFGFDAGTSDGGVKIDGGVTDGGFGFDGGTSDGGVKTDGGVTDGGFGFDGGTSDGGVKTDGGSTTDGGFGFDGGSTTDGGIKSDAGVGQSGDAGYLVLNVITHDVGGTVLLNGATPTSTCSSASRATVRFVDSALGYDFSFLVPCNGATTPFTWSGSVFPGTYRVTVTGGLSSLPTQPYVVHTALTINSAQTSMSLDVRTHDVGGTVLLNSAQPTSTCSSASRATVRFTDTALGYDFSFPVPCNGATTPFTFTGSVFPGIYRVTVTGGLSNLPTQPYVINAALPISSAQTAMTLNVVTHDVSGTVTLNGGQPTSTCSSASRATVRFVEATLGYDFSVLVPCNGATTPFAFSGTVFPGTYRVTVTGGLSNLPTQPYVIDTAFAISSARSGLIFDVRTFDVSGTVLMNGQRPTSTCSSASRATVRFFDSLRGYDFSILVPCNGATTAFDFTGTIFPGTYRVTVTGGLSSLPQQPYVINTAMAIAASQSSLVFDVVTHDIAGTVLQNGGQPTSTCSSASRATVRYVEESLGYDFSFQVPCNGATTPFTFTGTLFPGTYRVTVAGGLSSLPSQPYVISLAHVVSSPQPNLVMNVLTYGLAGHVLLNGLQPTSTCSSASRATITFTDSVRGYTFTFLVPCNGGSSPFEFVGLLYPGDYRVTVTGGLSSLPQQPYVALTSFKVP